MTEIIKMCFTCHKSECGKFYNVQNYDKDKISYLDKLKSCITVDLLENDVMEMCWLCIKHLRISYNFRQTVLSSQEVLRKKQVFDVIKEEPECDVKIYINESDSEINYFSKSDCSSEDDACKDIIDTVNSLTKKLEKRRMKKKRTKTSEISLDCEYCGTSFTKQWQLKKHLSRVHNETRKYICTYCNKEFKQSFHLKEHITSHTGEKNYTCPICEKKFQRLSSQRRHVKSHDAPPGHKTKRTPFLCTICGKNFPFSNGVQRHMRIHLGIKNFECKLCSRRFTQSTHLQVHMRTHTGEKPYICDTCGEKFSLKSCMIKHINNRHCRSKNLVDELPIFYFHKNYEQT